MATDIRRVHVRLTTPHVPLHSRLYGLGSVFAKALRDSRLGILAVTALLGTMVVAGGMAMVSTYGTPETRRELALLSSTLPPVLRGFYGNPVRVDTLGGFLSWHYGAYFALISGLWSILALSSTLAGEARRGSLDLALATPHSRRAIAYQKLAAHVVAVAIAMAMLAVIAWLTGIFGARLEGDAISPQAAAGFVVGVGVRTLAAGAIAFALAPALGRGAAAGIAGAVMVGGFVLYGYRTVVPAFEGVSQATWFSWAAGHLPLAGEWDWGGLAVTAAFAAVLLVVGVEIHARRDVGVTVSLPTPGLPRALLGVRGPLGRSLGDLLPTAIWWGVGLGAYGLLMAASSRAFADLLATTPDLAEVMRRLIPNVDVSTTAGFLQLAFTELGFVLIGLAAATLVGVHAADEAAGRLELQLATPLTRARYAVTGTLAIWLGIAVVTVLLAASIAAGVVFAGADPLTPALGTVVLAGYGIALAGIGVAVAGVAGGSLAAPVVLGLAIGIFLIDMFAPILRLPDWVEQLALTAHLGQPMIGEWDVGGSLACLALALGGLAVGAWGLSRRDVRG